MVEIGSAEIQEFLQRLGARYPGTANLYLLGGSALCLLGSPRQTMDIDYRLDAPVEKAVELQTVIEQLATEMNLELEAVPIEQFIPLPEEADIRHRRIDQFGGLSVYIYDPYSIALSKVARGFETDLEDVLFMLHHPARLIELKPLAAYIDAALPRARAFDIDPAELRQHLADLLRLYHTS